MGGGIGDGSEPAPQSVYQRVLGEEFARLSPQLQRYFGMPDVGTHGEGAGVFETAGSAHRWLWPLFRVFASQQILFPERGRDVPFDVINRPVGDTLRAVRVFHFPGRDRAIVDEMRVIDGALHDFLGTTGGLEVALNLAIADGQLLMTSTRTWLRVGGIRVRVPGFLSARVELTERFENGHHHVAVSLRHPVLGEVFVYRGAFDYSWVADETATAGRS